jgi:hypothetical protein
MKACQECNPKGDKIPPIHPEHDDLNVIDVEFEEISVN